MTGREGAYRLLLRAYPQPFRAQHEVCMLVTLQDGARDRGFFSELRELASLAAGAARAHGSHAHEIGQDKWRHGPGALLGALTAINLAVVASAFVAVHADGEIGIGRWWALALLSSVGLAVAVAFRWRVSSTLCVAALLVPLGYDEWLQATGRGDEDHFSIAAQRGFNGPTMSPFWLFVVLPMLAAAAAKPGARAGRPAPRLAALALSAVVIAVTIPASLYILLALATIGALLCTLFGAWNRRLHGTALALWLIALPYVFLTALIGPTPQQIALLLYIAILPAIATIALVNRRRRQLA